MRKTKLGAFFIGLILLCGAYGFALAEEDYGDAYMATLMTEMNNPALQGQMPMAGLPQVETALKQIDSWSWLIGCANRYQLSVERYNTVTVFKERVRAAQTLLFPMLRQATADALQAEMPKYKVSLKGDKLEQLFFTSRAFRGTEASRELLEKHGLLLKRLRFTQAAFMLDHEDLSTLSRFQPPQDTDIVLWDEDFSRYSLFH